jgi:hypothetical protein
MPQTVQWTTPDGVITFTMLTYETLNADIVRRRVLEGLGDIEEVQRWSDIEWRRASSFATCISHTTAIEFNMPEKPSLALIGFVDFWERNKSHRQRNYDTIYEDFSNSADAEIYGLWCDSYNETRDDRLVAPPELQEDETQVEAPLPESEGGTSSTNE